MDMSKKVLVPLNKIFWFWKLQREVEFVGYLVDFHV